MRMSIHDLKEYVIELITDLSLWVIKKTNRYKNRCLAKRLHDLALLYDPDPLNTDGGSNGH